MFRFSRGRDIRDVHPEQLHVEGFADFVAMLDADRAPVKSTASYLCGPLNGDGRRCAAGALPRRWLALDLDKIEADTLPDVRMWFMKFSGAAWPTHSSTAEAPRERVLVELDREVTRDEAMRIGAVLKRDLDDEFGADVVLDPSTFRAEQPVFLPPTGVTLARFFGDPINADDYLAAAPVEHDGDHREHAADEQADEHVTDEQLHDLRDALFSMQADDRDLWVVNGQRLKRLGNVGRDLWLTWSKTSTKFDPDDAARVWASLEGHKTGFKAIFAAAQANGWTNPGKRSSGDPDDADDADDGKRAKNSQATQIVGFVIAQCEVFHDSNRDVYARVAATGEVYSIDTRAFRDWLSASFYTATGAVARDQAVREAIGALTGIGRHDGPLLDVYIRSAAVDGAYYIDLGVPGSSRTIKVESGGWSVIDAPPVMFLRPSALLPLPEPQGPGNIDDLFLLANIPATHHLLVLAWLVEALRPDTPFPLLELIGEAGSAKSTTQRILRRLVDDNQCPLRASPKSVEDIYVGAGVTHVFSLENVSALSAQMQDALCTLATGGGFATRTLFTNRDETIIQVKRPTVINGIVPVVTAHDLIDRCITVDLPKIDDKVEEREVVARFEALRPHLLAALLDLFASALRVLPSIEIDKANRPRLVEFARLGMAIAKARGIEPVEFLRAFKASRAEAVDRTIEASPAASALVSWIQHAQASSYTIELSELLRRITPHRPPGMDNWPQTPKGLGNALRRAAPALRAIGIDVVRHEKQGGTIRWTVKRNQTEDCDVPA